MALNPLSFDLYPHRQGRVSCMSMSENLQMAIVIFPTNEVITFTGVGQNVPMYTRSNLDTVPTPTSKMNIPIIVMFFSAQLFLLGPFGHGPFITQRVIDPVIFSRPYGYNINISAYDTFPRGSGGCQISFFLSS